MLQWRLKYVDRGTAVDVYCWLREVCSTKLLIRIVKLLATEIIPVFGVPEALLMDRGTNLLSHLMLEVCQMLGIQKLNTTAYPECDGMVEQFKAMLQKHVHNFGTQWDDYQPGLLWAYRNVPHDSTGKKLLSQRAYAITA